LKLTLGEIAQHVKGSVIGDAGLLISGVSEIQNSKAETITFLGNLKYKQYLADTFAAAIFVTDEAHLGGKPGVIVPNPQRAIAQTLALFFPENVPEAGVHPSAHIDPSVTIGNQVFIDAGAVIQANANIGDGTIIGPNVVIGEHVVLGKGCRIRGNVTIYSGSIIGSRNLIHSGTTIGCDGFGFVTQDGIHEKIPQTGNVIIGDDVEIGSNCAIDRATIGSTQIDKMTKIDNLVHIAHNVTIGKGCLLTASFAIAGSSQVGDYCTFAGQVGVAPHVKIGSHSTFAAKSGVTKSLEGGKVYAGFPAREIRDHHKREALLTEVERMRQKLDQLIHNSKDK